MASQRVHLQGPLRTEQIGQQRVKGLLLGEREGVQAVQDVGGLGEEARPEELLECSATRWEWERYVVRKSCFLY